MTPTKMNCRVGGLETNAYVYVKHLFQTIIKLSSELLNNDIADISSKMYWELYFFIKSIKSSSSI